MKAMTRLQSPVMHEPPSDTLMLSVSGLRGLIGQSLTPPVAARYGAAFGSWLREVTGRSHPRVVVGRDSRPSGPMIEHAAVAGLLGVGCRVTTVGIATTPSVAIMTEQLGADGGMVITASHNPAAWNGIKALRHDGVAPPPDQAANIISRFRQERVDYVSVEGVQAVAHDDSAAAVHVGRILPQVDGRAIESMKVRVVLDSAHGAGGPATAMLLNRLGVDLVHEYAEPTGRFPGSPEPTAENLGRLCEAVRAAGAAVGFAQDPDADRLAIVDEAGRYIGEEYTLALAAMRVLQREPGPVAANLSTSRMIDDVAGQFGCRVERTAVGEANVAACMRRIGATVGGEGNGGVIWPRVVYVRDSLTAIGLVLDLMAATGKTVSQLVASIPAYCMVKLKQPIRPGMAAHAVSALRAHFAGERIDEQDGIRIDLPDGWVHVRASNTEPILRIIAEGDDELTVSRLVERVIERIEGT